MKVVAVSLALTTVVLCGAGKVGDRPSDLERMAGEWVAESWNRTGQVPAPAESLAKLTLKIEGDQWIQAFGKDVATYTITLNPAQGKMTMKHNKVAVVLDTTYVLTRDKLIVTEVLDREVQEIAVKVWRRKGQQQ